MTLFSADQQSEIVTQLDAFHARALQAWENRDIEAYRLLYPPDVQFTSCDDKTCGIDEMLSINERIFSRLKSGEFHNERELVEFHASDHVSEIMRQDVCVDLRFLLISTTRTNIERRTKFTWQRVNDIWKLIDVNILEQSFKWSLVFNRDSQSRA